MLFVPGQAERPISSVGWVRFLQDPCEFQIYYKDIEEIVTDYTAESPYECGTKCRHVPPFACPVLILILGVFFAAEIVAKLKYILSRMKSG